MDLFSHSDANLLPIRRLPSVIEMNLYDFCVRLQRQRMSSLAAGHRYEQMDPDDLRAKIEECRKLDENRVKRNERVPGQRSYFTGRSEASFLKKSAISNLKWLNEQINVLQEGKNTDLNWDIDALGDYPVKAISSWYEAFHRYRNRKRNNLKFDDDWKKWHAFQSTSFYLLSLFMPCHIMDHYNPLRIARLIEWVNNSSIYALLYLRKMYPKLAYVNKVQVEEGDSLLKAVSKRIEIRWRKLPLERAEEVSSELRDIFENNIEENGFSIEPEHLDYLVDSIVDFITSSSAAAYFMPFVCTKLFCQLFFVKKGIQLKDDYYEYENYIDECLLSYETLARLFNDHQKVVSDDIFGLDAKAHPVIRFMQDVAGLSYRLGMSDPNMFENDTVRQNDVNWLTLYYYGRRRYFDDPGICSEYCGLTLPLIAKQLFWEDGKRRLAPEWLYRMMCYSDGLMLPLDFMHRIRKKVDFSFIEADLMDEEWRIEMIGLLSCDDNWEDNGLAKINQERFSQQINHLNQMIVDVQRLLKVKEDYRYASLIVKMVYLRSVIKPFQALMRQYYYGIRYPDNQIFLIEP